MSEWYFEVDNDISVSGLEQGDVLKGVNLYGYEIWQDDESKENIIKPTALSDSTIVILTQTCDLVNGEDKMPTGILVAVASDYETLVEIEDPLITSGSILKSLENDTHPRLKLFPPLEGKFNWHIVDFGNPRRIHKSFYIYNELKPYLHLRLNSPYRENLSQSYARHIMRVALDESLFGFAAMAKIRNKEIRDKKMLQ